MTIAKSARRERRRHVETFAEYQREAAVTAGVHATLAHEVSNWALGLCGEAGEVGNLIKKHVFHGHALDVASLKDECSDVLWYLAMLCTALGMKLEDVAGHNLEKLESRYPEGFSSERSRNRVLVGDGQLADVPDDDSDERWEA